MSRKQRIVISITGIVLVMLILVGLTYAYFLTRINGNTNDKSISVSTANLELKYDDIEQVLISEENVEPGKTWTKKFSATNTGSKKVESYGVALENVINTLERTEDLVYTLNCTSSLGTTCNKVEDEQEFPTIGKILITNSIESKEVQNYELTITYKEQNIDQSIDMNKQFSGKVNIVNPSIFNPYVGSMLNSVIIGSAKNASEESNATRTTLGSEVTEFTSVSGENERVLNNAPDDYGTSYYYRGNVLDNYVSFGGLTYKDDLYIGYYSATDNIREKYTSLSECQSASSYNINCTQIHKNGDPILWRIVRINGDESVRLVLDDVAKDLSGNEITIGFNPDNDDNAYIGYMYGMIGQTETNVNQCIKLSNDGTAAEVDTTKTTESACTAAGYKWALTPYDATHVNVVNSNVKTTLENWYKTNIIDTNNASYVADTLFCNDKTLASNEIDEIEVQLGYGINDTYYSSVERLQYSTGTTEITTSKPTFKCAENAKDTYSRFTVNETTLLNGNKTNGALKYPIGLLSADEVAYAGAYKEGQTNTKYYLYNSAITTPWWLSTPHSYYGLTKEWVVGSENGGIYFDFVDSFDFAFRPTLNLKASVFVSGGDGTKENPYTVKLAN